MVSRQNLITDDIFDRILDDISQFNQNEDVYYMLTGDFNARTSVHDDCLQVDLSLHIPVSDDYKVDTVLVQHLYIFHTSVKTYR